jgi:hypothetical protein
MKNFFKISLISICVLDGCCQHEPSSGTRAMGVTGDGQNSSEQADPSGDKLLLTVTGLEGVQRADNWCWAACIGVCINHDLNLIGPDFLADYGLQVDAFKEPGTGVTQDWVVRNMFGSSVDSTATPAQMEKLLEGIQFQRPFENGGKQIHYMLHAEVINGVP